LDDEKSLKCNQLKVPGKAFQLILSKSIIYACARDEELLTNHFRADRLCGRQFWKKGITMPGVQVNLKSAFSIQRTILLNSQII
jgi:hypothetical protein